MRPRTAFIVAAAATMMLGAAPVPALQTSSLGVFIDVSSRIPFTPSPDAIATDVECIDMNGDGDQDLYVTNGDFAGGTRRNVVFSNNGAGSFAFAKGAGRRLVDNIDISIGDVNGDGFRDAIIAVNLGGERLLIHNGASWLLDMRQIPAAQADRLNDQSMQAVLFDADGDTDLDIAVANVNPAAVGAQNFLWINNGAGTFSDQTASRLPPVLDQTFGLAVGDIDGDGDRDLISVNDGQDLVLVNSGAGFFADETIDRLPVESFSGRQGVLADVDGDGDLDYVQGNGDQEQSRLYLNEGNGHFADATGTHLPQLVASTQDVDLADIDGDGDLDAYLSNVGAAVPTAPYTFTGEQDALWENDGTGHFVDVTAVSLPPVADSSFGAAVCDVDGDGDADVTVSNGKGEALRLYVQT